MTILRLFKNYKIYPDEVCPCGSGKAYSACCEKRNDKPATSTRKPIEVQISEKMRKAMIKCCLYPDKTRCVKHIKEAHALQNNKIISKLAADGHVYMLNSKKPPLVIPIENEDPEIITLIDRVGVNHATTATCFCDVHDDEVFAPIEKNAQPFDKNNTEHRFLYSYKAFIFEYYKELVLTKVYTNNFRERPSLLRDPIVIRQYRETILKMKEMDEMKKRFDTALITGDFDILSTQVLEIPEEIQFANFSCIAIDYDLNGKRIKHTKNKMTNRLFITAFPEDQKSFIIIGYLKKDERIYGKFTRQLIKKDIWLVKYFFTLMLPLYSENIVLSPQLWERWDEQCKMAFTFYANRTGRQFEIYKMTLKFAMQNLKSEFMTIENASKCKINLFP